MRDKANTWSLETAEAIHKRRLEGAIWLEVQAEFDIGEAAAKALLRRYGLTETLGTKRRPSAPSEPRWERPCSNCGSTELRRKWMFRCSKCHREAEFLDDRDTPSTERGGVWG